MSRQTSRIWCLAQLQQRLLLERASGSCNYTQYLHFIYSQSSKPRDGAEKGEGALCLSLICTKYCSQSQKGDRNEVLMKHKPYVISQSGVWHSPAYRKKKEQIIHAHCPSNTAPSTDALIHPKGNTTKPLSRENAGYQASCTGKCVRQHLLPQQKLNQKQNCRQNTAQSQTRLAPSEYSMIPYP